MKCLFVLLSSLIFSLPMQSSIKAIAFDFGGVMTFQVNRAPIANFLKDSLELSHEQVLYLFDQLRFAKLEKIPFDEFWYQQAEILQKTIDQTWLADLKDIISDCIAYDHRMYDLINRLKEKGYKVALLSNVQPHKALLIKDLGLYEPFDPLLLSCETGHVKPNPEAFKQLIAAMGLSAEEIAFIDDKPSNIAAANGLGLQGLHFQSYEDLLEQLSGIGVEWMRG